MKSFDIELAKAGHPVQTRDGRPARIICYDRKDENYPIVALVENPDFDNEDTEEYTIHGKHDIHVLRSHKDLFMSPTKKEGWININADTTCNGTYPTKELAISLRQANCVVTKKIEWEE